MAQIYKHKAIMSLPEPQQHQVDQMIRRGETAEFIANVIQKTWGASTEIKADSLRTAIMRYRQDMQKNNIVAKLKQSGVMDKVTNLARQVDVVDGWHKLYHMQMARVEKLVEKEDQTPFYLPELSSAMEMLASILDKMGRIHLEIGLLRRVAKSVNGTVSAPNERGEVSFRLTEDTEKLFTAIENDAGSWAVPPEEADGTIEQRTRH